MMSEPGARRTFQVETDEAGRRLDHFLTARCEDLTRSQIQRSINTGGVSVDGRERPSRFRLGAGQQVAFTPLESPPVVAEPEDIPLNVLYQDDEILVVDKCVGMVVHPAPGHYTGTLVNALLHRFQSLPGGDSLRAGIVHRLDKDTSGLMVVALTETSLRHIQGQLQDRSLGRTYEALSWGQWKEDEGTLTGALGRHPGLRQRMAVLETGGKSAVTHYTVLEDFGFVQRCEVKLQTGRTHQIRVHFAHNSHPVVGDGLYGDDTRVKGVHPLDRPAALGMVAAASRQMLHARDLRLSHPVTGETMSFTSPPPDDFTRALKVLRDAAPSA